MSTTTTSPAPMAVAGNGMGIAVLLLALTCFAVVLFAENAEPTARARQTDADQHK